ncbi:MAG: MFS transporter [Microscillaceae bacterium]|nr:MFS transporter [Microscillaceae bacterium]
MYTHKPRLWTRDFILLTLTNLFLATGSFLLIPVLPIYVRDMFGASKTEIGYIMGFYTLSALLLRPFAGFALDALGRKSIYLLGLALFVLLMPSYAWVSSMWMLLGIRFLQGMSWGIVTTGGSTIASDIVPLERRGEGIGYFGMSFTIAMALGPVLGLTLIQGIDYPSLFYLTTTVALITFVLANLIKYPQIVQSGKSSFVWTKDIFYDARVIPASMLALISSGVYGGLISFIGLFMEESGIRTGYALMDSGAAFFMAYALGLTIIRPIAGVQMDRHGPAQVMGAGFIALIIGLLTLASAQEIWSFLLASLISGIGMGVIMPTVITMVVNMVEPQRRGVANSTFFSAVDIGVGVGTVLLGRLADLTSVRMMYYYCAGLMIVPLILFFFYVLKDYQQKLASARSE